MFWHIIFIALGIFFIIDSAMRFNKGEKKDYNALLMIAWSTITALHMLDVITILFGGTQ